MKWYNWIYRFIVYFMSFYLLCMVSLDLLGISSRDLGLFKFNIPYVTTYLLCLGGFTLGALISRFKGRINIVLSIIMILSNLVSFYLILKAIN